MPLNNLPDRDIRGFGKEYIESLEYWLRIVIDRELRTNYVTNYINAKDDKGNFLLNGNIRKEIETRYNSEKSRYPRPIDACLLDTAIEIITKPHLFKLHFRKYFELNFKIGREMVAEVLNRLIHPRNCLYHSNPISIRALEQIVCYTNDIIDSIKDYYNKNNMNEEFNVPKILRFTDSFGNSQYREQFNPNNIGKKHLSFIKPEFYLYPGDKLKIEVEMDTTFKRTDYTIKWGSAKGINNVDDSNILNLLIEERHIGDNIDIQIRVVTNESWHKFGHCDDFLLIRYRVLPRK